MIPVMVPNDVWATPELGAKKSSIKAAAKATILFIDLSSEEQFASNIETGQHTVASHSSHNALYITMTIQAGLLRQAN